MHKGPTAKAPEADRSQKAITARIEECAASVRSIVHDLVVAGLAVPRSVNVSDYVECLDAAQLGALGIRPPDPVLQILSRVPHFALCWIAVLINSTKESSGITPNWPLDLDATEERLVCISAGMILAHAADSQNEQEATAHIGSDLKWVGDWLCRATASGASFGGMASNKIEGQRWVLEGVYDQTIPGQWERVIHVKAWGIDLLVRGLSGERRHQLIERVRENPSNCFPDLWYRVAYYGVYDPVEPNKLYWRHDKPESLRDLGWNIVYGLAHHVLALSFGLSDDNSMGLGLRRGATDRQSIDALLDLTKVNRSSTSDDHEALKVIASRYLHEHQWGETGWREWQGGQGRDNTLYGYVGKGLTRAIADYQTDGTMEGDRGSRDWLVFPDRPEVLDYLRETKVPKSDAKPGLERYDGDHVNDADHVFGFEVAGDQVDAGESDRFRSLEYPEIEKAKGRQYLAAGEGLPEIGAPRALDPEAIEWIQTGPLERFDEIDEDISVRHDILQAFEATYSDRALLTRDYAVFCARYFNQLDRCDIPAACGLSGKEAEAAWRQIDRKRPDLRDWLAKHGYAERGPGHLLPIPFIRRLLAKGNGKRDFVSGSTNDESGNTLWAREILRRAIQYLERPTTRTGDTDSSGKKSRSFTYSPGWANVARLDFRRFGRGGDGGFALRYEGNAWVPQLHSLTATPHRQVLWTSLKTNNGWHEWRAPSSWYEWHNRLSRENPDDVPPAFNSDDRWWLDHGIGTGLPSTDALEVNDRVLRELGAKAPNDYRWNDLARGAGCYWWVLGEVIGGIFTGMVVCEPAWGPAPKSRSATAASFETRITHSQQELPLGRLLNGNPIIQRRDIGQQHFEYLTRGPVTDLKPHAPPDFAPAEATKLRVFLDDDPAEWSERFGRLPRLATSARLQRIWSTRKGCQIFRGPVDGDGRQGGDCKCEAGQHCLVFQCSQCSRGAVPLHWVAETTTGHCAACCATRLAVWSGGIIHGPFDERFVSFLHGDIAPVWAEVLVLGPGDQPVHPELATYRQENRDRADIDYPGYGKKK